MTTLPDVTVTMPQQPGTAPGQVQAIWHAVDGVRVEVRFPAQQAPTVAVGRAGELSFSRPDVPENVGVLGKVAFRGDLQDARVYHFLFGDRTRQSLAHLLEPRRTHRVHPDEDEPVEVTVMIPGEEERSVIASARDVSINGIGVDVPWEFETRLAAHFTVELRLRLPGRPEEHSFMANVRNRSLGKGAISYGLEFPREWADDEGFKALAEYVASREAAEAAKGRKSA